MVRTSNDGAALVSFLDAQVVSSSSTITLEPTVDDSRPLSDPMLQEFWFVKV